MAAKGILVLFVQAVLAQTAYSQCIGAYPGIGLGAGLAPGLAYDGLGRGCAPFTPTASGGGSFIVTSSSPVAPTGITVVSENIYEGALVVGGNLPMLGSVGVEGEFPTAGAGAVSYGCGDGDVGIIAEEGPIVTGITEPAIAAPYALAAPYGAAAPFGYGYGIGYGLGYGIGSYGLRRGAGCGCRAFF